MTSEVFDNDHDAWSRFLTQINAVIFFLRTEKTIMTSRSRHIYSKQVPRRLSRSLHLPEIRADRPSAIGLERDAGGSSHLQWEALVNTSLGVLMGGLNTSVVLIALPAIFRGLNVDPLGEENASLLLWMLMGFPVVTTTLLVTIGRASDMFGRVRMYVLGFAIFTVASALLSLVWSSGTTGAVEIIGLRLVQAVGSAFLFASSAAILTDFFPSNRRGFALGTNQLAMIFGTMAGLILGGVLAVIDWRLVFAVSIPFGAAGTLWALYRLPEGTQAVQAEAYDPFGNLTLGIGLIVFLGGLTYALMPQGSAAMGWRRPDVEISIPAGLLLVVAFFYIETRVASPMFRLDLFRIRVFAAGNLAGWLASIARGGLQFVVVIWLQGVWLPLHGYDFQDTPLWAGIYMLPMMFGYFIGPLSGYLSDRLGPRPFATAGMLISAVCFVFLARLDVNFSYLPFAALLFVQGIGTGLFTSPNTSSIMNSVPAKRRGVASGMRAMLVNSGQVLSMVLFFTIIIAALSRTLPLTMERSLVQLGMSHSQANELSHLPPTAALFAAFLGYNPLHSLIPGSVMSALPAALQTQILSREFFPTLISKPLMQGLSISFYLAAGMSVVAAIASLLRGRQTYGDE